MRRRLDPRHHPAKLPALIACTVFGLAVIVFGIVDGDLLELGFGVAMFAVSGLAVGQLLSGGYPWWLYAPADGYRSGRSWRLRWRRRPGAGD
jgi:hypothetical protein